MREAWESNAEAWIAWARSPALSRQFWLFHLPRFLEVVPAPGRLTLDLGCGEGRLGRELAHRGHRVVGVDGAPALARAAVSHEHGFAAAAGDATALPFSDGCADLVVSMMTLQNVQNLDLAFSEAARVLDHGGNLVFAVLHPFKVASDFGTQYFEPFSYRASAEREGLQVELPTGYHPLSAYFEAMEQAGLLVYSLHEPVPDADVVRSHPAMAWCLKVPCMLIIGARRP
jgi:SAM-dependent methyltransferase